MGLASAVARSDRLDRDHVRTGRHTSSSVAAAPAVTGGADDDEGQGRWAIVLTDGEPPLFCSYDRTLIDEVCRVIRPKWFKRAGGLG